MIKVLEKTIADKIAAGEVIERPVSIVKELVENAIDAGSDTLTVEIKNGGKSYIRVSDNGCGIPGNEVETAFLRHATSKIETAHDLNSIDTLGFRGEALASIAAVTRTELITKVSDSRTGTRISIHGGSVVSVEETGCPDGTTVIVQDLFYNTPARLKFMKSDAQESSRITALLSEIALAYKNIKIRYINNGKVVFSTTGDGNRLSTIARVYPDIVLKNLVPLSYKSNGIEISGYISTPAMSKTTRASQIFFVNGRVVNSRVIEKGINLGYRERLFEGRFPVCYIFLEVDPATLDVNIHPNKREVRFDNENIITEAVANAIIESLSTLNAVVDAGNLFKSGKSLSSDEVFRRALGNSTGTGLKDASSKAEISGSKLPEPYETAKEAKTSEKKDDSGKTKANEEQVNIKSLLSSIGNAVPDPHQKSFFREKADAALCNAVRESTVNDYSSVSEAKPGVYEPIEIYEPLLKPFDFSEIRVTGTIFDTYITAVDDMNFYLIDQHAAQERIFYEKLVGEYDSSAKARQPLLIPLIINVSLKNTDEDEPWMVSLDNMGFTISEFGPGTYRITEVPMFMEIGEAEDFVNEYIENISERTDLRNTVVINKLIMMSCKAAVKAHDRLSPAEVTTLMKDLANCRNPYSCPHGRPTVIKLTQYEIEKMFKRV